jgi:hypothetical protein
MVIGLGCATRGADFEASLGSWVGKDVNLLVSDWGPATRSFQAWDGSTTYVWERPGQEGPTGPKVPPHYTGMAVKVVDHTCTRTVNTDEAGKILEIHYAGGACY